MSELKITCYNRWNTYQCPYKKEGINNECKLFNTKQKDTWFTFNIDSEHKDKHKCYEFRLLNEKRLEKALLEQQKQIEHANAIVDKLGSNFNVYGEI